MSKINHDGIVYPFGGKLFLDAWEAWKRYKLAEHKFKYKSLESEQAALHRLQELSEDNATIAISIIRYSMAMTYKGLFKENKNGNGNNKAGRGQHVTDHNADQLRRIFGSDSKD